MNEEYNKYLDFIKNNDNINSLIMLIKLLDIGKININNDELEIYFNFDNYEGYDGYLIYSEINIHYNQYVGYKFSGRGIENIIENSKNYIYNKYGIYIDNLYRSLNILDTDVDTIRYDFIDSMMNNIIKLINERCKIT